MAANTSTVNVAVGVITKDNLFFVCRRKAHQHQGNKWEFPGGKLEADESVEQALKRELREEIGIELVSSIPLITIEFNYPDKHVNLLVQVVQRFTGTAHGAEGQESKWVNFSELRLLDFPAANQQIIQKLEEFQ
jgi:8-oxo-dGTP diphosphatase